MKCPNCGARVPEGRASCPDCGLRLEYETAAMASNKPLIIVLMVILAALLVVTFLAITGKLGKQDADSIPTAAATAEIETEAPAEPTPGAVISVSTATPEPTATPAPTEPPQPTETPAPAALSGHFILPESNSRLLTEEDLEGLSERELMLARNEIFARHGFIFSTQWIQGYFLTQDWYHGTMTAEQFDGGVFNVYERGNIDLILRVEAERAGG